MNVFGPQFDKDTPLQSSSAGPSKKRGDSYRSVASQCEKVDARNGSLRQIPHWGPHSDFLPGLIFSLDCSAGREHNLVMLRDALKSCIGTAFDQCRPAGEIGAKYDSFHPSDYNAHEH